MIRITGVLLARGNIVLQMDVQVLIVDRQTPVEKIYWADEFINLTTCYLRIKSSRKCLKALYQVH